MTAQRLSIAAAEQLAENLGDRDRGILTDVARVRVLTGNQLTRLHFADLSPRSRDRTRRRVLARLATRGLVTPLERRIGGVRAGSAGLIFALGVAGQRVLPLLTGTGVSRRARRPWTPSTRFLAHTLAVAELYVQLVEASRTDTLTLAGFVTESASWVPNGLGGWLKPDAYTLLRASEIEDSWWVEVDRASESLPTVRGKLLAYVDFANAGQLGPHGVTPRVLVTVPDERRLTDIRALIDGLPEPGERLIHVVLEGQAVSLLTTTLNCQ